MCDDKNYIQWKDWMSQVKGRSETVDVLRKGRAARDVIAALAGIE